MNKEEIKLSSKIENNGNEISLITIATYNDKEYDLQDLLNNLLNELQRKDNIIKELKEKINQFTLIIGYYDYNDEGYDEIGENNNLQEELLNIINLDKIKELENDL